jgi:ectoine hydroxylase-related dioxygenase (phytanoyl-CoA dioxygenase family)
LKLMTESELRRLDEAGYVVLENFAPPELLDALRRRIGEILEEDGAEAGREFRQEPQTVRLANLVARGAIFADLVSEPRVLAYVAQVLGPDFKLSSLNYRSADPHGTWVQPLHCDTGALPDERGNTVCNVIWLLDDFTPENGATRVVPGSHRFGRLPEDALADPSAPHPDEVLVTGKAGSVVVMNTHAWHGATANRTAKPRRALHSFYCRRDQPQQQYQKKLLSAEVQAGLSAEVRRLLALDEPYSAEAEALSGRSGFLR